MGSVKDSPSLFDDFPNPVAHACDPLTSHEAALAVTASGVRARHAEIVLQLVQAKPGATAIELMAAQVGTDLTEYQIRRRLVDLEAKGLVEKGAARACLVRGTKMVTWRVVGL